LDSDKDNEVVVVGRPKICPTNPKWRTASILKKDKLLHLSNGSTDFSKFCRLTHTGPPNPKRCSKNQIFKNPRWRTAAILKIKLLNAIFQQSFDRFW